MPNRLARIKARAALGNYRDAPDAERDIIYLLQVIDLMGKEIEAITLASLDPDND